MTKILWAVALAVLSTPALAVDPLRAPQPLAAPPADAIETASGMSYIVLKPAADQNATVRGEFVEYRADIWSADGVTRANSRESGNQVVPVRALARQQPALARALLSQPVGETRRWWIQPDRLAPGYPGMPNLLHVVDLTVVAETDPLRAPADVGAVPADALRTASGLAYKIIHRGGGSERPPPGATVEIDYTGWTLDGRPFDSSLRTGSHAFLPLGNLIAGWQEGVPLMAKGDTYRFWIPGHLAYDASPDPSSPRGTLVFDITLYGFQ